jgi:diguanylate cyclase (GGDEF)-like protein
MNDPVSLGIPRRSRSILKSYALASFGLSLAAVIATFLLSFYVSDVGARTRGVLAILGAFAVICGVLYVRERRETRQDVVSPRGLTDEDIEARLKSLDEASEFFAGSLKVSDAFRLVISRISGLVAFTSVRLFLVNTERDGLLPAASESSVTGEIPSLNSDIAQQCYADRDFVVDPTAVAVPLKRGADVVGVLEFGLGRDSNVDTYLLDAIGERVAPIVIASASFERTHSNALVDPVTALPNERAFHLVLENQVAECVRKGGARPLAILSFDIKQFDEMCLRYGHSAGDRLLGFVAENAKECLRQMDFLTRGSSDEFLAILPTASHEISTEVIARIRTSMFGRRVRVSDVDAVELECNFGWASFGPDGETPAALLRVARERRSQADLGSGSVVWFPQTYAN